MITDRDLQVLHSLARYFVLNRQQVQRLCFSDDNDGRVTRRRLLKLVQLGVIQRQRLQMHDMNIGSHSTVFYPARTRSDGRILQTLGRQQRTVAATDREAWPSPRD